MDRQRDEWTDIWSYTDAIAASENNSCLDHIQANVLRNVESSHVTRIDQSDGLIKVTWSNYLKREMRAQIINKV